ncbi:hypothetical protein GS444_10740 [Rhodococcus hoagii]|nr:hypothetical protein [Prescottella equi]
MVNDVLNPSTNPGGPVATDKLTDVHQKVMGRYKSRVPGSAYEDDMLGYIHQIDKAVYEQGQQLKRIEDLLKGGK